MRRPATAPNGDRARRRELLRRPPPVDEVADGFAAADRVVNSIRQHKQFLRDTVEVWSHTEKKRPKERGARPMSASSSLGVHQLLWTPADIEKQMVAAGTTQRRAPWQSTMRDLDKFNLLHIPLDEDDEEESAEEKAAKSRHAAMLKLKATQKATHKTATADGGDTSSSAKQNANPTATLKSTSSVPPDAVVMKYILAIQSLKRAVHAHPRPLMQQLFKSMKSTEGVDVVPFRGHDIRAIRRKTFNDRLTAVLMVHPHHTPLMKNLPTQKTDREKAIQRVVVQFQDVFNSFDLQRDNWIAHRPFVAALSYLNSPTTKGWIEFIFSALSAHDSVFHVVDLHAVNSHITNELVPKATQSIGRIPFARASVNPDYVPPPPPRPLSAKEKSTKMWGQPEKDRWSAQINPIVVEAKALKDLLFQQAMANGMPVGPPVLLQRPGVVEEGVVVTIQAVDSVAWKDLRNLILEHSPALADVVTSAML